MQETHRAQFAPARGVEASRRESFRSGGTLCNCVVKLGLMIVIEGQRSMRLGQRNVGVLTMDFLCTPTVGKMVHRYLDHFDTGIVYPGLAFIVQANVVDDFRDGHWERLRSISLAASRMRQSNSMLTMRALTHLLVHGDELWPSPTNLHSLPTRRLPCFPQPSSPSLIRQAA